HNTVKTDATPTSNISTITTTPLLFSITAQPTAHTYTLSLHDALPTSETGSSFECRIDGGSWNSCTSPDTLSPALADGSHTFDVRDRDHTRNTYGTPASYIGTVDTTTPNTSITAQPSDPSNNTTPSFSF